jgi:DNA-directed RNA polymerase sigma subunit (sigma70/sigma32)
MIRCESRNSLEPKMANAGDGVRIGERASGEESFSPQDMAVRALRMLERLIAGSTLTEVAADEGLTPRRARQLVAEAFARRGLDP